MREQRGFRPATLIVAGAAALLCVTFAVLTPGAANAIGTWTPPVSVSGTGPGLSATPQVTTDPSGNTFAVWVQNANTSNTTVDAAMRPAGSSTWTSATVLSQMNVNEPAVVSDSHGNVTAMWYRGNAVESATRPAGNGSVWGSVQTISPSAGNYPLIPPSLVADTNGNLSAAWQASAGAWNVIQVSSRPAGASSWSTPTTISLGGSGQDNNFASLAYSPSGDLMAVWEHYSGPNTSELQTATRAAGSSSWSAITTIAPSLANNSIFQLVFDPSGNATVLYTDVNSQVAAASLPAGSSTWTTPAVLTTGADSAPTTALVTDSHGMLTAAWYVFSPPDRIIVQTATRPAGVTSAWTTPTTLTPNSSGAESVTPQLAVDPNGNVTCVWLNYVTNVIQSAAKPVGRTNWSPVVDVFSSGAYNSNSWPTPVTSDPNGMITVVWISATNNTVTSSTAAGLSLTPANQSLLGTVGVPLTGSNAFTANGFTSAVSYTVSPALPAGLVIDPSTGVISGTPSVSQAAASYVVSAQDSVGFVSTATVQITVGAASSTASLAATGTDTLQPATAGAIALISGGLLLGAVSLRRRRSVS